MTPKQAKQQHRELTEQERLFTEHYAKQGDAAAAMRHAAPGRYKHPRQRAHAWLHRTTIKDAISAERARLEHVARAQEHKAAAGRTRTREGALRKAWAIVDAMSERDPEQARVALQALDRLAKAEGWDQPTEHRSVVRYELQVEYAQAIHEAALAEFGEDGARRLLLRLAGKPVAAPVLAAEWEPGE